MADQRRRIHPAQLVLGYAERHNRGVLGSEALIGKFLVERHIAVAVDRADDGRPAARRKLFNLADDGLIVLMVEGRTLP